jgi:hypothetical protein
MRIQVPPAVVTVFFEFWRKKNLRVQTQSESLSVTNVMVRPPGTVTVTTLAGSLIHLREKTLSWTPKMFAVAPGLRPGRSHDHRTRNVTVVGQREHIRRLGMSR